MKTLTDEQFEQYEESEQIVDFIKSEYPYLSEGEVFTLAKSVARKRVEDMKIDLKKKKKSKKPFHGYNKKKHAKTGGLNDKARKKYNRETGSNLKRPVTSKNPKGKAKARKKSFCARMSGVKGPTSKEGKLTPKGAALKRWKC